MVMMMMMMVMMILFQVPDNKEYNNNQNSLVPQPWFVLNHQHFTHICFCIIMQTTPRWKRQIVPSLDLRVELLGSRIYMYSILLDSIELFFREIVLS